MDSFVSHPMIKPETLKSRVYQEEIVAQAVKGNTLCVLPTGLGKTPISILISAHRLEKYPQSRIMVLAPTRPLVNQHYESYRNFLNLDKVLMEVITGVVKPKERKILYKRKQVIFATPQTIQNDIKEGIISLRDFSLVVFDEAHHSIGRYSYPFIASKYMEESENPLILGLSASPGGTKDKIDEIVKSLHIDNVEIRTEIDEDVKPYVFEKEIDWVKVDLPESFVQVKDILRKSYEKRLQSLKKFGLKKPLKYVSKKDLVDMQRFLMSRANKGDRSATFWAVSLISQAIKIEHSIELLESQGIGILESYFRRLQKDTSKAAKSILNDKEFSDARYLVHNLYKRGSKHPKISKLCSMVYQQLKDDPNSRIIIFANYRDAVMEIVSVLNGIEGARPIEFVGQKEGLSQKEQILRLNDFKEGTHNILVGTSISEEGLDIASANLAIFYEPVASPLRAIQRRGRVGRASIGKVLILVTNKTRDEAYLWASRNREKTMTNTLYTMKSDNLQKTL